MSAETTLLTDKFKDAPSASSLDSLSVVAVDSTGSIKRAGARLFSRFVDIYLADANQPGIATAGEWTFRTDSNTLNLPEGVTKWGLLKVRAISATQYIEEYLPFQGLYMLFVRRFSSDGTFSNWVQVI